MDIEISNINQTGAWLESKSTLIIDQWLGNEELIRIFKEHKISLIKFSTHFAIGIIKHAVDVMQNKKEMADCPSMNKFVDLMLQKKIQSNEILIICVVLRKTIFENLRETQTHFFKDPRLIITLLKIFDANLLGVFQNFDKIQIHRDAKVHQQLQKELNTLKYLAYKDPLTELDNLRGFEKYLENMLKQNPDNNVKILILSLNGFDEYKKRHTKEKAKNVLKNVAQVIKNDFSAYAAHIKSNRFAIVSNELTLKNSQKLITNIDNVLTSITDTQYINTNAAIILLHDKETPASIIEHGEILLNSITDNQEKALIDDTMLNKKEQERLREETIFLSQIRHLLADKQSINVVNYYMEIPIQSSAKIINITQDAITITVRKISAISLHLDDIIYIEMPKEPNLKAKVTSIDSDKNQITLKHFEYIDASPLARRNIHVALKDPLEILVKSEKIQILEELSIVSITTFVIYLHYLYNIEVDSELTMFVKLLNQEEKFVGIVDKIIPTDGKFKLIVHLKHTPSIEKSLVPFVSQRQLEIIKELQEKSLY